MSSTAAGGGLFLELRAGRRGGLLVIRRDVAGSPAAVSVTGGASSLHIRTARGLLRLGLPAGVSHEQGSCLQTEAPEEEELHFRLRIRVDPGADNEAFGGVMERLRAKESYCFYCQGCRTRLLEDRTFQRVLPLPNGNWNTLVDDWCCHADPFANKKLLPRPEDCLLGDTFLLLARDDGCEQTLVWEAGHAGARDGQDPKKPCRRLVLISCQSCSSVLGEAIAPETLKLYITQIVVEATVGDSKVEVSPKRSQFLEQTIAARLLELSSTQSTFHFTVQTPDEKAFLLLWLLNSDSIMASVSEEALCGDGDGSISHDTRVLSVRALKLLWVACSAVGVGQKDLVASWEANAIGHPLTLPPEVCEELLRVMEDSNALLPQSLRSMRSYQVAYLKL